MIQRFPLGWEWQLGDRCRKIIDTSYLEHGTPGRPIEIPFLFGQSSTQP
jgi:hypothetical protein